MRFSLAVLGFALLLSAVLSLSTLGSRQQTEQDQGEFALHPYTYLNFCIPLNGGCQEQEDLSKKPDVLFLGSIQKVGDGEVRSWANVTNATESAAAAESNATMAEPNCTVNRVGVAFNKESLEDLPSWAVSWYLNLPPEVFNESLIDHITVDWYPANSTLDNTIAKSKLYEDKEYIGYKFWLINETTRWQILASEADQCMAAVQLSAQLLAENFTYSNKCVDQIGAIFVPGDAVQNETLQLLNISVNYALFGNKIIYVEIAILKDYLTLLASPNHSDDTGSQSIQPPKPEALHQLEQFADLFSAEQPDKKAAFPQVFRVRYLTDDLIPGCAQYQLSLDSFEL